MPPNEEARLRNRVKELYRQLKHVHSHQKIEYQRQQEECDRIRDALADLIEDAEEAIAGIADELELVDGFPAGELSHHIDRVEYRLGQQTRSLHAAALSNQNGICVFSGGTATTSQAMCWYAYHSNDWAKL